MRKSNPIRTCVACRIKLAQNLLNRYRARNGGIELGAGDGRSFYICDECLKKDEKILKKILDKHVKGSRAIELASVKEILLNGRN